MVDRNQYKTLCYRIFAETIGGITAALCFFGVVNCNSERNLYIALEWISVKYSLILLDDKLKQFKEEELKQFGED